MITEKQNENLNNFKRHMGEVSTHLVLAARELQKSDLPFDDVIEEIKNTIGDVMIAEETIRELLA